MKMLSGVLFLAIVGAILIGVWIEYYGRTCPACKRRKAAMLAALGVNGAPAAVPNGNGAVIPIGAGPHGLPPGIIPPPAQPIPQTPYIWAQDPDTGQLIATVVEVPASAPLVATPL